MEKFFKEEKNEIVSNGENRNSHFKEGITKAYKYISMLDDDIVNKEIVNGEEDIALLYSRYYKASKQIAIDLGVENEFGIDALTDLLVSGEYKKYQTDIIFLTVLFFRIKNIKLKIITENRKKSYFYMDEQKKDGTPFIETIPDKNNDIDKVIFKEYFCWLTNQINEKYGDKINALEKDFLSFFAEGDDVKEIRKRLIEKGYTQPWTSLGLKGFKEKLLKWGLIDDPNFKRIEWKKNNVSNRDVLEIYLKESRYSFSEYEGRLVDVFLKNGKIDFSSDFLDVDLTSLAQSLKKRLRAHMAKRGLNCRDFFDFLNKVSIDAKKRNIDSIEPERFEPELVNFENDLRPSCYRGGNIEDWML